MYLYIYITNIIKEKEVNANSLRRQEYVRSLRKDIRKGLDGVKNVQRK